MLSRSIIHNDIHLDLLGSICKLVHLFQNSTKYNAYRSINNINFKHSAARIVTKIVKVNQIQQNQKDFTVWIRSFDKKNRHLFTLHFLGFELPSFPKQCDTLIQRAVLHFQSTIMIKTTIGSSISLKLEYEKKIKQYNDQSHSKCVRRARLCNKQQTHFNYEGSAQKIDFDT